MLNIAVGERTELSLNTRIDDGMTNGAGNVIKLIQVHQTTSPSGIVRAQLDHTDVGAKTRQENRHLYVSLVFNLHGLLKSQSPHNLLLVGIELFKL